MVLWSPTSPISMIEVPATSAATWTLMCISGNTGYDTSHRGEPGVSPQRTYVRCDLYTLTIWRTWVTLKGDWVLSAQKANSIPIEMGSQRSIYSLEHRSTDNQARRQLGANRLVTDLLPVLCYPLHRVGLWPRQPGRIRGQVLYVTFYGFH